VGANFVVVEHECRRGGVVCFRNWSEAGDVLAELGNEMRCIHWFGSRSLSLTGYS
jgi:hypothetical protein